MSYKDLKNQLVSEASILPGNEVSGSSDSETGEYVDCELHSGPVFGLFILGNNTFSGVSGTPASQSHVCKLQEADDTSGTNLADITDATVTLTAQDTNGIARGVRGRRYVRAVVTSLHVAGGNPVKIPVTAIILGEKQTL